ncbi:MAG: hypothetical protein P4L83_08725 [Nevskia sp.]|nr:hypothetical protein [Nevskia sp.]
MTRVRPIVGAVLLIALAFASSVTLYRSYHDDEMGVYVALLQTSAPLPEWKEAAFMGDVSTCHVNRYDLPVELSLFQSFRNANASDALPRPLEKLAQLANVVAWKDARYFHENGNRFPFRIPSSRPILRVSRVGFNASRDRAVLCLESPVSGSLLFFEKVEGPSWRQVSQWTVWVS